MTRALLGLVLLLAACSEAGHSHSGPDSSAAGVHSHSGELSTSTPALSTEVTTARATGTVMSVGPTGRFVTLDHAPIPEINMGAMRMGFDVGVGVDVSDLRVGDAVAFNMESADSFGIRITDICVPAHEGADCLD